MSEEFEPLPTRTQLRRVQEVAPAGPEWFDDLIVNERKRPAAQVANAITAFRQDPAWSGAFAFNEFTNRIEIHKPLPWDLTNGAHDIVWSDRDDVLAADWLQRRGVPVTPETVAQAVLAVAGDNAFHPVRDYLTQLAWDGTPRLNNWLVLQLGAMTSPYVRAVGRKFLVSAVARACNPGCKADVALILEGAQGIGKSTALRLLAEPWFTDEIGDFGSKEAAEQTAGVWLIEIAELGSLSRPEVSKIKAFMSRSTDRYRPAYGRRVLDFPRQCVFAGTVNGDDYLRDETGGRRFWPVRCGDLDLAALERVRDQLWAEAYAAWRDGEKWWLDRTDLIEAAWQEQAARYREDPWQEIIERYLSGESERGHLFKKNPDATTSVNEILLNVFDMEDAQRSQADCNRIARCLKALGWERFQKRDRGAHVWLYRRVTSYTAESGDRKDE